MRKPIPAHRRVAANYWTISAVGFVLLAVHIWWFLRSDHQGDVLSGGGAALGVLGIYVAARPYVRLGLGGMIEAGLPQDDAGYLVDDTYQADLDAEREAARPQVVLDVYAERVVAVTIIVLGVLLNGYASALARAFTLRDIAP